MKKVLKEYIDIFINFVKNKKYLYTVIFVTILSYGFTITHYAIGADDLCFDRYVQGTYILSAKRWGTWLLYNVLNITEFSPFWLECIVTLLMVIVATILCTFMKKIVKDRINTWGYIIFSSVFITNPIIFRFFVYQSTNLAVVVSNAIVIILAILLFENFYNLKNKRIYLAIALALIIPISMYESSAQTFLLVMLIACLLKAMSEEIKLKEVMKIIGLSILSLGIGCIGYYLLGKILLIVLDKMNILHKNFAEQEILWLMPDFVRMDIAEKLNIINERITYVLINDIKNYLPVTVLAITSVIVILIELKQLISTNKALKIVLILGIILSNFVLIIMQGDIKYRIQYSWIIVTAFLCMYIYIYADKKKIIKVIVSIILIVLVIVQSRSLNQMFYTEWKKYEKEKIVANEIARDIGKCENWEEKSIVYVANNISSSYFVKNSDNGAAVLIWGILAFEQYGEETTKFINDLGYNLKSASSEDYIKAIREYDKLEKNEKDHYLIERAEYIIVNLDKYMSV